MAMLVGYGSLLQRIRFDARPWGSAEARGVGLG